MKKFIIRSVISFLLIFIFVSGVSYVFYHRIAEGYVDSEISTVLKVNAESSRDMVDTNVIATNKALKRYYEDNKTKNISELNTGIKNINQFKNISLEFGIMQDAKLITKDYEYVFNSQQVSENYINNDIYFLNYTDVFSTEVQNVKLFFTLDVVKNAEGNILYRKVAILDSAEFFNKMLVDNRKFAPTTYFITEDGYVHYKTTNKDVVTSFFDTYLKETSPNYTKKDFQEDIINGKENVIHNLEVSNEKSYIVFMPLAIKQNKVKEVAVAEGEPNPNEISLYMVSVYKDQSLVNLKNDLVLPLSIMFAVLSVILLAGISALYAAVLKKNSDIEASKIALYYSKPYILKINKKGKIVYKNNSFKKLNFDWKKYSNVYYFDLIDNEIDILGAIKKRKSITIQMTNEENKSYTFFLVPAKVNFGMYLLGQEVTEKFDEITSLIKEVTYDNLTNLPNKKILFEDLEEHLKYINNEKNVNKNIINSSLMIFSIQRLERLINIFGSATADKLVINFIEIVKSKMNDDEVLYRFDKDIFGILFKNVENYDKVIEWINDLMTELKRPISIDENQLMVLIKCGIFNIELDIYDDLNESKIYECAEIAFNHANGLSSIDYMVYNISLGRLIKKEQLMEEDLKSAIENNEFVVYVQPQYDTDKNKIVGFEALTRWNNPKYLTDSPQHFIEMAEKNNMIVPIGRIITEQAFAIAKQLEEYNIVMSINVSPAQMMQDGFVSQFIEICDKYQTNPEKIAIEITETFLVQNFKVVNEKLTVLKKHGFKIHLDDFGTGYSSLLYLKDLPIDAIKIDKEFTKYINTDKRTRAIVSKLISLASSLELYIIAEGVEDEKQSLFLNKNGCSVIQGWLIGKAMPVDNAIELLKEYNINKTKVLELEPKKDKKKTKSGGDK